MTPGLTVREAADKTGLTGHTLRYYERVGLIWDVPRDAAGHRRYTAKQVEWLLLLTRLRATGLPIAGMLRYAELVRSGRGEEDRLDLLQNHRIEVAARLAELTADLALIDRKIETYQRRLAAAAPHEEESA
ncbi:MerR family transcriptional regulator [Cryptosporangium minutisporangium]|uniref:MerR family transcriptional regulator n=1 Tax=Cryptosporangium minutisporangium TaxID=113569 RepID=A0ABP6T1W5_9ACTN